MTLTGTVTRIEWMNPHTWIYLDVKKEDGSVEAWAFEMGSPNRLMRYGWNQDSLPTGATVTIAGSQARDGSLQSGRRHRHVTGRQAAVRRAGYDAVAAPRPAPVARPQLAVSLHRPLVPPRLS